MEYIERKPHVFTECEKEFYRQLDEIVNENNRSIEDEDDDPTFT